MVVFIYSLLSTIIHEFGHAICASISGGKISGITINPFGWSYVSYEKIPSNPLLTVLGGVLFSVLFAVILTICCRLLQKKNISKMNGLCYLIVYLLLDNGMYLLLGMLYSNGDAQLWIKYGVPSWLVLAVCCLLVLAGFFLSVQYKSYIAAWNNASLKELLLTLGVGLTIYLLVMLFGNIIQAPERYWFWIRNFLLNLIFILLFVGVIHYANLITDRKKFFSMK